MTKDDAHFWFMTGFMLSDPEMNGAEYESASEADAESTSAELREQFEAAWSEATEAGIVRKARH